MNNMKPKIVFITKSLCYHQVGIADNLFARFGEDFAFVQMREPLEFRVKNKQEGFERPYLITYSFSNNKIPNQQAIEVIRKAEIVIWGEASLKVMKDIKKDAILLKYSERIFKNGYYKLNVFHFILNCINLIRLKLFLAKHKNAYLLSAGSFSYSDYKLFGMFKGKALRWGYFPTFNESGSFVSFDEEPLKMIWVNRLLKWKHPEFAIEAARLLKSNAIPFELKIVGDGDLKSGEMKNKIMNMITKYGLSADVKMLGKVQPENVFDLYKQSHIALFSSGPAEGWGVGLSEAMNFGCLTISSNKMGSTEYLIKNGKNGFIYKYKNKSSFMKCLLYVAKNYHSLKSISENAINTISSVWNCKEASNRLSNLIEQLLLNHTIGSLPKEGPLSLIEN